MVNRALEELHERSRQATRKFLRQRQLQDAWRKRPITKKDLRHVRNRMRSLDPMYDLQVRLYKAAGGSS